MLKLEQVIDHYMGAPVENSKDGKLLPEFPYNSAEENGLNL